MEIGVLGSGSSGNAVLIRGHDDLLVDCGFSVRATRARLGRLGVDASSVKAIVVTHEHSDHGSGAGRLARAIGVPIWASPGTLSGLGDTAGVTLNALTAGQATEVAGLTVTTFGVPHDSREPTGLRIESDGKRIGLLTDAGHWTKEMAEALSGSDALIVESNHDEDMLDNGLYPAALQRRIRGRRGHLSNTACSELLANIVEEKTRTVVLSHLSRSNNLPELALATSHARLERSGKRVDRLVAAHDRNPIGPFVV